MALINLVIPHYVKAQISSPWRRKAFSASAISKVHNSDGWEGFRKNVSGEWSGIAAVFDKNGKPSQLPYSVVPEAYREWGIEIFDWDTYCASVAHNEQQTVFSKTMRLFPSVGCGSTESMIYQTEEKTLGIDERGGKFLAFHPNGSYAAVLHPGDKLLKIEQCLTENEKEAARIRLVLEVTLDGFELRNITVYKEKWEAEFQNGQSLECYSTRAPGFATTPLLQASSLKGTWQMQALSTPDGANNILKEMCIQGASMVENAATDNDRITFLPAGLWCCINIDEGGFETEVGWLVSPLKAIASKCYISSSGLVERAELRKLVRVQDGIE